MASTFSPDLRLELIATGEQSGTWGATTNTNLGTLLEQAIAGVTTVAQGNVANKTLTASNGASDEARNMVVEITGALTAARNVVVPTADKIYLFRNSTTGGFNITVKTTAGTGVAIPAGESMLLVCDATNVVNGITMVSGASGGITYADNGAGVGPVWSLFRDSASPAVSDLIGSLEFNGRDSAGNKQPYARILADIRDPTSTSEAGSLVLQVLTAGAYVSTLTLIGNTVTSGGSLEATTSLSVGTSATVGTTLGVTGAFSGTTGTFSDWLVMNGTLSVGTSATVGTTLGVTGVASFANGTAALPSVTFSSDPNTGIYRLAADNICISTGGAKRLDVSSAGLGVTGALSATGAVSGTTGSFSGALSGTTGTFSGAVSGTTGTFSSGVDTSGGAITTGPGNITATGGTINAGVFSATGASAGQTMNPAGLLQSSRTLTTLATHVQFYNPNGLVGSITTNTTATAYNTTSDGRLKQDFADFDAGAIIDAIQIYEYRWKADGSKDFGPKAQELFEVYPQAVSPGNDKKPGDEGFVPWGWDASKLVPLLIREVQSLRAEVQSLRAEVQSLLARVSALEAAKPKA